MSTTNVTTLGECHYYRPPFIYIQTQTAFSRVTFKNVNIEIGFPPYCSLLFKGISKGLYILSIFHMQQLKQSMHSYNLQLYTS